MDKLTLTELAKLFTTMSNCLKEGLPVSDTLLQGSITCTNPRLRMVMGDLIMNWDRDGALTKCMARHPDVFQTEVVEITEIALTESTLGPVWEKVAVIYQKMADDIV